MKMQTSSWAALAVGFMAIGIIAGCNKGGGGGGFSSRNAAVAANVLRYAIPTNPTTLDPAMVQDGDTIDLLQQVYEGLVGWDEKNEVVGLLAESWTVSDDAKIFTFKLKDAKFQNGRAVEAGDVKWSIERACSPKMKSETCTAYLGDISGINEFHDGKAQEVTGIKVIDPKTIEFSLSQPAPYFLGKLTYLVSAALPKESVPESDPIKTAEQMVGTGPYKVTKFEDKILAELEPFNEYWGGKPSLTKIERPVIIDAELRLTKFKNGELDLLLMQRQDLKGVESDAKLKEQIVYRQRAALYYIGMNQIQYKPFKDVKVRQAFAKAIDRHTLVAELLGGVYQEAETIVPPGIPGHRDKGKGIGYDPEGAKKLLAEAGYPGGKGLPELVINFQQGKPDIKTVAEAVAGQLKQNLGIEVRALPVEWTKYLEDYNNSKLSLYHMRWSADFYDMQNFLSNMIATGSPENTFGYSSPEFDRLCHEGDTHVKMEDRIPFYQQAEDVALSEAAWIPIYYQRDVELVSPSVKNLRVSLGGYLPHTTTSVERTP